jgi:hypothetical protein
MASSKAFVFSGYNVLPDNRSVKFHYQVKMVNEPDIDFTESWVLPVDIDVNNNLVRNILDALLIGVGISYYKIFVPSYFELPFSLSEPAAKFWNLVYRDGMSEFLYINKLDPAVMARFDGLAEASSVSAPGLSNTAVLGIGGGKDSIVAGELLKNIGVDIKGFVFGTGTDVGQTQKVADDMGIELLKIARNIDLKIIELNKRSDTLSGHVPISMLFALASLLLGATLGHAYGVVANEFSASEENIIWNGLNVNHQWSKSFIFEKAFQSFVASCISPDMRYFSAIRPLTSVAVAKLFSRYPVYLGDFTSCNLVFRIDPARRPAGNWCGECAKCLSSFILLAPWIDSQKLIDLFGKNMLNDGSQKQLFLELTGVEGHKPLDCVGTTEEIILSLNLASERSLFSDSAMMTLAKDSGIIRDNDWQAILQDYLQLQPEEAFPDALKAKLLDTLTKALSV